MYIWVYLDNCRYVDMGISTAVYLHNLICRYVDMYYTAVCAGEAHHGQQPAQHGHSRGHQQQQGEGETSGQTRAQAER